jgi:hypothetical protein
VKGMSCSPRALSRNHVKDSRKQAQASFECPTGEVYQFVGTWYWWPHRVVLYGNNNGHRYTYVQPQDLRPNSLVGDRFPTSWEICTTPEKRRLSDWDSLRDLFLEEHARLSVVPSEIYPSSDRWTFFIQQAYHVSV